MRQYRVWRKDEERALRRGVSKHGTGAWEMIRTDPEFAELLKDRTGVQLKDKWRNLVKFNHLSPDEVKASCGGSARTRSGLRQRQRSTSPRCRSSRSQTRCATSPSGSPAGTSVLETLIMTPGDKVQLLEDLRAIRRRLVESGDAIPTAVAVASAALDSGNQIHAAVRGPLAAVDSIIAAVRDVLGSTGCVAFDRAMLQRCPGPAVTRVRRHLPSMTSELLAAVAAATPTAVTAGNPSVTPSALPVSPVLGLRTMPEAAKGAKAALECAVGGSSLTAAPASAAAVSVSPTHSRQQSAGAELQRKRSRELSRMDEDETMSTVQQAAAVAGRPLRQAPPVITTGVDPAPAPGAGAREGPRAAPARAGMLRRRHHSVGRLTRTISASDLMAASLRDCRPEAALQPCVDRGDRGDAADTSPEPYVEDDFLQSLYRNCFSKHGDSGDALLFAPTPCPPSPTWGGQTIFSAPTRASAPQLPIGCSSPAASFLRGPATMSASPGLPRQSSVPQATRWPSPAIGAPVARGAPSPPLSGSSVSTVVPPATYGGALGIHPTSSHSYGWPLSGGSLSHPSSVSSLMATEAPPPKSGLGKGCTSSSFAPMDTSAPRHGQYGAPVTAPAAPHMGDTSGIELLLGEWGPQQAPQRLSGNGRYPCVRGAGGPPMSTSNLSTASWTQPLGAPAFRDAKPGRVGIVGSPPLDDGVSETSGSIPAGGLAGLGAIGHNAFADVTDAYGVSLLPRGEFQGVLDSLSELESCYGRTAAEVDDMFPSCRSTMSFV